MNRPGIDLHRRRRPGPCGLTAIELLVALALASMLMVAILGLFSSVNRQCRELVALCDTEPWQRQLADLVRRDLSNARQMVVDETTHRLVLQGYLGTEGLDLSSTHQAAEVTYHVAKVDQQSYLVRDERALFGAAQHTVVRRLVATDVLDFHLVRPDTESRRDQRGYSGPVPASGRLVFLGPDAAKPIAEVAWCR